MTDDTRGTLHQLLHVRPPQNVTIPEFEPKLYPRLMESVEHSWKWCCADSKGDPPTFARAAETAPPCRATNGQCRANLGFPGSTRPDIVSRSCEPDGPGCCSDTCLANPAEV